MVGGIIPTIPIIIIIIMLIIGGGAGMAACGTILGSILTSMVVAAGIQLGM